MGTAIKWILSAAVMVLLAVVLLTAGFFYHLTAPADSYGEDHLLVIREGWTLRHVSMELQDYGIIKSPSLFLLWARIQGEGRNIRAGEYRVSPRMSPIQVLDMLTRGSVITHTVTIPEGYTVAQIASVLDRTGLGNREEFLELLADREFIEAHRLPGPTLEGYLFPDTYQFARGLTGRRMAVTMIHRFWAMVDPLKPRMAEMDMSIQDVVTLASIIEKETGHPDERPLIASVFLNRLERGMRLDSDPTVIYGIRDFEGRLTRKHLRTFTPYNTYRIRGLPPGPIANPGEAAIKAVLYPAESDYFYFVSRNDGSHQFSRTLAEHNRAVRIYQRGGS